MVNNQLLCIGGEQAGYLRSTNMIHRIMDSEESFAVYACTCLKLHYLTLDIGVWGPNVSRLLGGCFIP